MNTNVPAGAEEEVGWGVNCALMTNEICMRSPHLNLGLRGPFVDSDLTSSLGFISWDLGSLCGLNSRSVFPHVLW